MQWIKHMTRAAESKKFNLLRLRAGKGEFLKAYGFFWLVTERIATDYPDGGNSFDINKHIDEITLLWDIEDTEVTRLAQLIAECRLWQYHDGVIIHHKIAEYADEYTKKRMQRTKTDVSGDVRRCQEVSDFVPLNRREKKRIDKNIREEEVEEEEKNKTTTAPEDIKILIETEDWCKKAFDDGVDPLIIDFVLWKHKTQGALKSPRTYAKAIQRKGEFDIEAAKEQGWEPFKLPWQMHADEITEQLLRDYKRVEREAWDKYQLHLEQIWKSLDKEKRKKLKKEALEYQDLHRLSEGMAKKYAYIQAYYEFKATTKGGAK